MPCAHLSTRTLVGHRALAHALGHAAALALGRQAAGLARGEAAGLVAQDLVGVAGAGASRGHRSAAGGVGGGGQRGCEVGGGFPGQLGSGGSFSNEDMAPVRADRACWSTSPLGCR